jgi:hypothetical protein
MIHLNQRHRSRLFLAMTRALDVSEQPSDAHEVQRQALCELVTNFTGYEGDFTIAESCRLADSLLGHISDAGIEDQNLSFQLRDVARLVGQNLDVTRASLRLIGAQPTFSRTGDDWSTAPGQACTSIRFPSDTLVRQIQMELEEAQNFAAAA